MRNDDAFTAITYPSDSLAFDQPIKNVDESPIAPLPVPNLTRGWFNLVSLKLHPSDCAPLPIFLHHSPPLWATLRSEGSGFNRVRRTLLGISWEVVWRRSNLCRRWDRVFFSTAGRTVVEITKVAGREISTYELFISTDKPSIFSSSSSEMIQTQPKQHRHPATLYLQTQKQGRPNG